MYRLLVGIRGTGPGATFNRTLDKAARVRFINFKAPSGLASPRNTGHAAHEVVLGRFRTCIYIRGIGQLDSAVLRIAVTFV